MPRHTRRGPDDDEDDADGYDAYRDYDPDDTETYPEGLYEDGDLPTISCPYCRDEIVEDSERCPQCGNYLSAEDRPAVKKSGFWTILMVLALLAAACWAFGG